MAIEPLRTAGDAIQGSTARAAGPRDAMVAEVCRGVARGDHAALTRLYSERFEWVVQVCRALARRDEAFGLDAAQEVFLRVIRSERALRSISTDDDLDRWLIRLARSVVIDALRREHRRRRRETTGVPSAAAGATIDDLAHLRARLAELDAEDQLLLRLRARGQTLDQVGEQNNLTPAAAHGRIRRAVDRLARLWHR